MSAGLVLSPAHRGFADSGESIVLRLRGTEPLARIPANFMGLGYEMSSAATQGLLNAENSSYVQLLRGLGPKGVLRIGGIVADFTRYEPDGPGASEPKNTVITRAALAQMRDFLKATGWTTIWSLNFGKGSLKKAIAEARDVAKILGLHLEAVELGNEVENYGKGRFPLRKADYSYEDYRAEYVSWHTAILQAIPGLRFAAPDTAASVEWVERMAEDAKGDVQLLTTHYYRGGQRQGTLDQLMQPDPALKLKLERLAQVTRKSNIPWRMCETNSFFGGGRPGISDTFAGALWVLDYMLLLAQYGCAGVNIESGVNQLGFESLYSPIRDDSKGPVIAGIPYYGMLAFASATSNGLEVLPVEFDNQGVNLTAYVLGRRGHARTVVVVNRDSARDARISFEELGIRGTTALRLSSPSISSNMGVTFGGAAVDITGQWKATHVEHVPHGNIFVPHMSAVVLR